MSPKKFEDENSLGTKKIWDPKKYRAKKFGSQKHLGPKKVLVPKKFWSRENLGPEQILTPKYLKQKKFGAKNFGLGSVGKVGLGWQVQGWVRLVG